MDIEHLKGLIKEGNVEEIKNKLIQSFEKLCMSEKFDTVLNYAIEEKKEDVVSFLTHSKNNYDTVKMGQINYLIQNFGVSLSANDINKITYEELNKYTLLFTQQKCITSIINNFN